METAFDWIAVMAFAGLVTHFLAGAVKPDGEDIALHHYLIAAIGCGLANWVGNQGYVVGAALLLLAVAAYAYRFLHNRRHD